MTKRVTAVGLLLTASLFSQTRGQVTLPRCLDELYFDACSGARAYANGDRYVGEFHNNLETGQGTYTFANGKYEGEFRDGAFNGKGFETFANGDQYTGEFRQSMFNGLGTLTYAETAKVGELRGGSFDGRGAFLVIDGRKQVNRGDKYTGGFRDNYAEGQGTYTLANGDKYVGPFHEGTFNGAGVYTFSSGSQQAGDFFNGAYSTPPLTRTAPVPTPAAARPSRPNPPASPVKPGAPFEVTLQQKHGVLFVPAVVNETMNLDFVLDSGAADVTIPADIVMSLMRSGTLTKSDFFGTQTYILADGSRVPSPTFRIRSLRVGDKILENVAASVASANGSLLLGQSFLKRFRSWSIDNQRQVLLLQ